MPLDMESGSSDQFATVRTISAASTGRQDSRDFLNTANSGIHAEATEVTTTWTRKSLKELEAEYERQREVARVLRQREAARFSNWT